MSIGKIFGSCICARICVLFAYSVDVLNRGLVDEGDKLESWMAMDMEGVKQHL